MKALYRDRLVKLANHLKKGKLGHKTFSLKTWHDGPADGRFCGTAGCAVGECPVVFPIHWVFEGRAPSLKIGGGPWPLQDAAEFFGLGDKEAVKLFMPQYQKRYGGARFGMRATAKQVGNSILAFVKTKTAKV